MNGTDHHISESWCDLISPARRTINHWEHCAVCAVRHIEVRLIRLGGSSVERTCGRIYALTSFWFTQCGCDVWVPPRQKCPQWATTLSRKCSQYRLGMWEWYSCSFTQTTTKMYSLRKWMFKPKVKNPATRSRLTFNTHVTKCSLLLLWFVAWNIEFSRDRNFVICFRMNSIVSNTKQLSALWLKFI